MVGMVYFDKFEFFDQNYLKVDNKDTNKFKITIETVEKIILNTVLSVVEEKLGKKLNRCMNNIFACHDTCSDKMQNGIIFMPINEVIKYISGKFGQKSKYDEFHNILYSVFIRTMCLKNNRINSFERAKDFRQYLISKFEIRQQNYEFLVSYLDKNKNLLSFVDKNGSYDIGLYPDLSLSKTINNFLLNKDKHVEQPKQKNSKRCQIF